MNENVLTKEQSALAGKLLPELKDFYPLPSIKDLAAMKAYALGRRSKWKDYVDLYFVLKSYMQLDDLIARAKGIFSAHFNSKLFREQLCYFDDMDYSESIDYLGDGPSDEEVKAFLEKTAVAI